VSTCTQRKCAIGCLCGGNVLCGLVRRSRCEPCPTRMRKAQERLRQWIMQEAVRVQGLLGFGYVPLLDAPENYAELLDAWARSKRGRGSLPVFSGSSIDPLWGVEGNYAFRFVHDVLHCTMQRDFGFYGEMKVHGKFLQRLAETFPPGTLEWELALIDTVGQTTWYEFTGNFVEGSQMDWIVKVYKNEVMSLHLGICEDALRSYG
jgi:hypothetical protein